MTAPKPRLRDVEARAAAATEGPWNLDAHAHIERHCKCMSCYGAVTAWQTTNMCDCDDTPPTEIDATRCDRSGYSYPDATFIAASRTDTPALTAAIRAVLAIEPQGLLATNDVRALAYNAAIAKVHAALSAHIDLEES